MNIAFCIFKYFDYGGLQRDFRALIEECLQRGFTVDVYTLTWQGEPIAGVNVHIVPVKALTNHARYQKFANQLGQIFSIKAYDIVVGFNKIPYLDIYYAGDPCYSAKAMQLRGKLYRCSLRYLCLAKLERAVFASDANTHILLMTEQQHIEFSQHYHTPMQRFYFLTPWLREDKYPVPHYQTIRQTMRSQLNIENDSLVLLMVGSGFKVKGLDRALLAISALPPKILEKIQFYILGKDNEAPFMRLIQKLQLEKQVHFLGGQSNVRDYFYAADAMIHPAYSETAGYAILEAIVNGLPIVVTDNCGYAHHVEKANAGIVIPGQFSQETLNQALLSLLTSTQRQIWRENGFLYFSKNNFNNMSKNVIDYIEKVHHDTFRINDSNIQLKIKNPLSNHFNKLDAFSSVMSLEGEVFRYKENRKTLRFSYQQKSYFAKLHFGIGYKEIIKNCLQFQLPIVSAKTEWQAILQLEKLGIPTMSLAGYGLKGKNPATQQSFLITDALEDMINLEEFCSEFKKHPPSFQVKYHLTKTLAEVVKKLHEGGLNHRDLYFCHFLLSKQATFLKPHEVKLFLIDLHRVQFRAVVPMRWLVKDLGSLYFSTMGIPIEKKDFFRFMTFYTGKSLRQILTTEAALWQSVEKRGMKLYQKACRNIPNYLEDECMKSNWWVDPAFKSDFDCLERVFSLEGEEISRSPLSTLIKMKLNDKYYYVKRYIAAGRHLRKYLGRSRVKAEWENLLLFKSLGLPIPNILGYGEERSFLQFKRGALIVEELMHYQDLNSLVQGRPEKFKNSQWMDALIHQLAVYTRKLHQEGFIHNDLKWRNLLINTEGDPLVYFIDCPVGRRRYGWFLKRGIIKDLACLDKTAKRHLSRTSRLRFYFLYRQITTLKEFHKNEIKKIVLFHAGRE